MKVVIVKCSMSTRWYSDKIGKIFNVTKNFDDEG